MLNCSVAELRIDVLNPQVGYSGTNVIGYVGLPQLFERTVYHQVAVEIECFVELGEPFGNGIAVVGLQGDIPDVEIEVAEVGIVDNVEMYRVVAVSLPERREFLPVLGRDIVREEVDVEEVVGVVLQEGNYCRATVPTVGVVQGEKQVNVFHFGVTWLFFSI